ncbi:MAG: Gfo/Idh/MocA family oxidoreductase [Armatimonadetes bacterium]|nr:Gfo/Idh/MocA family oxidoreductase [Armatimonadota bacterium]
MRPPIRAGILGYGFAGRGFHAHLLTHEPRIALNAVATRNPARRERAHQEYGCATYATLSEMLAADEVDLVIVATPHHGHAEQAIAIMDAGKHCVVDKVMCLTSSEARAMLAARDRNGVLLSVFHNRRWDGDFLTLRQALAEGLIGAPRLFEIGIWRYSPPRGWRAEKASMGTIMHDWGAHFVDQMFQLVPGRVTHVTARAQYDWQHLDVESYISAEAQFDNGVIYRIELCNRARVGKPHWYIVGERGALRKEGVDPQEAAMLAGDIDAAREDPAHYAHVVTEIGGTLAEMRLQTQRGDWKQYYRNIADAILAGAEPAVKPEEAARGVAFLDAVQRAIATGETQQFPEGL